MTILGEPGQQLPVLSRLRRRIYGNLLLGRETKITTAQVEMVNGLRRLIESRAKRDLINLIHAYLAYPSGGATLPVCKLSKHLLVATPGTDIDIESSVEYSLRLEKKQEVWVRKVLSFASKILIPSSYMREKALESLALKSKVLASSCSFLTQSRLY